MWRRAAEARATAQAIREQMLRGQSRLEILHDSAFARLAAKQETMPVIERAKGIIMAQRGCGPEEAFDLLRLASQRANIKLHVLAEQFVERIAAGGNDGTVTPLLAGRRALRQGRTRLGRGPGEPASREAELNHLTGQT